MVVAVISLIGQAIFMVVWIVRDNTSHSIPVGLFQFTLRSARLLMLLFEFSRFS